MANLHKLAEKNNLELVNTTTGQNGYPSNLGHAIDATSFENFQKVEEFAEKHNLEIVSLHQRNGWHFWENKGRIYKPFEISSEDYGDNYHTFGKMDFEDFYDAEIKFFFEDAKESFEEIEAFLACKKEIFEQIELMNEDQQVVTHEGNYYETIQTKSLAWREDTHNYIVGLVEN